MSKITHSSLLGTWKRGRASPKSASLSLILNKADHCHQFNTSHLEQIHMLSIVSLLPSLFYFILFFCRENNVCARRTVVITVQAPVLVRNRTTGSEMKVTQSCLSFLTPFTIYSTWNSPGQNTGVGSLSLLQGIFPGRCIYIFNVCVCVHIRI